MADREVMRVLYRNCLAAAQRLRQQVLRHRTIDVFSESENVWLREKLPGMLTALSCGNEDLRDYVRDSFRRSLGPSESVDERLDVGFLALPLVNHRLNLLEQQAVDPVSDKITNGVRVLIKSELLLSRGASGILYKYQVKIKNESVEEGPVQLISRQWFITDADGYTEAVGGPGVVGKQPILEKGDVFEYESCTPLRSIRGTLAGTYHMLSLSTGELFEVPVGPLALVPS
jgi:ApaG protein